MLSGGESETDAFKTAGAAACMESITGGKGVWGTYLPLFENMGFLICPNLHTNREGGVRV